MYGYHFDEIESLQETKEIKDDARISKIRPIDRQNDGPMLVDLGIANRCYVMLTPSTRDPRTAAAGARSRYVLKPPTANRALLRRFNKFVKRWVNKHVSPLDPLSNDTLEAWLAKTNYSEARKDEIRDAFSVMLHWDDPDFWAQRLNIAIGAFTKAESYSLEKHARIINARRDAAKALFGPIFKLMEEVIYDLVDENGSTPFIKHVPVAERPQYMMDRVHRGPGIYVASDYSAFESLFSKELMYKCERVLYKHMVSCLPLGSEFLRAFDHIIAGKNRCLFKYFTITVEATRMSGEMNTSLGNGFTNLMVMLFACHEHGIHCVGCVEGDDGIFYLTAPPPSASWFESLGLRMKLEVHDDISEASFCGMIFDPVDRVVVTDPRKVVASIGFARQQYVNAADRTLKQLLKMKGMSFAHQYNGCPIVGPLAFWIVKHTSHVRVRKNIEAPRDWWTRQLNEQALAGLPDFKPPTLRTRLLVERKFGISVEFQEKLEDWFNDNKLQEIPTDLIAPWMPELWADFARNYAVEIGQGQPLRSFIRPGYVQRPDPAVPTQFHAPLMR